MQLKQADIKAYIMSIKIKYKQSYDSYKFELSEYYFDTHTTHLIYYSMEIS